MHSHTHTHILTNLQSVVQPHSTHAGVGNPMDESLWLVHIRKLVTLNMQLHNAPTCVLNTSAHIKQSLINKERKSSLKKDKMAASCTNG